MNLKERAEARKIAQWFADPVSAYYRGERSVNADPQLLSLALLEVEKELEITDKLLDERNALLGEFPCPVHGQCIPYVRDLLRKAKEYDPIPKP